MNSVHVTMEGICDYYVNNKNTYIHFYPEFVYLLNHNDFQILDQDSNVREFELKQSLHYNICVFICIPSELFYLKLIIQKKTVIELNPQVHNSEKVFLQSCIVMKDEHSLIYKYIDYHKKYHGVNRFIIFDNNSTNLEDKQKFIEYANNDDSDIIYIEFNHPYTFPVKRHPGWFIVSQNTAYAIALKKYNAEFTMLLDLDEYVMNNNFNLSNFLVGKNTSFSMNGIWAGCNGIQHRDDFSIEKIKKISNKPCGQKLILQNKNNDFTSCIHWPQFPNNTKKIPNACFVHMRCLSIKNRVCSCKEYCVKNNNFIV